MGFRKHAKNSHYKSTTTCDKYASKRGSPKVFFLCFLRFPYQHGLQGVPGEAPRPKSISKGSSGHGFSVIWKQIPIHFIVMILYDLRSLRDVSTRCIDTRFIIFDVNSMVMLV